MNKDRITDELLTGNYVSGQKVYHTDFNKVIDVLKEGVNANFKDILALENGDYDGATFIPDVAPNGDLSWTNNKNLDNPPTRNIKGSNGTTFTPSIKTIEGGHELSWTNDGGKINPEPINILDGKNGSEGGVSKEYVDGEIKGVRTFNVTIESDGFENYTADYNDNDINNARNSGKVVQAKYYDAKTNQTYTYYYSTMESDRQPTFIRIYIEGNKTKQVLATVGFDKKVTIVRKETSSIKTYNTLQELKDDFAKLEVGSIYKTLGYYSLGDGGEATYLIVDNIDASEYQETLNNGLYANLIVNSFVNVLKLGVKKDYTEDIIPKVQKMINLLTNGGTIYFPNGLYKVGFQDYVNNAGSVYGICGLRLKSNMTLLGESNNAILKLIETPLGELAFYRIITSDEESININIKDICIDGNKSLQSTSKQISNIEIYPSENVRINNIKSINCMGNGIRVVGNKDNVVKNVFINNNIVDNCNYIGIQVTHFNKLNINNNQISNCADNGIDIYGNDTTKITSSEFNISDNIIDTCKSGIFPETVEKGNVINNYIERCTDCGIHTNSINQQTSNLNLNNNHVINNKIGLIVSGPQQDIIIKNNLFENNTECDISLYRTQCLKIINNVIKTNIDRVIVKTAGEYANFILFENNICNDVTNYIDKKAKSHYLSTFIFNNDNQVKRAELYNRDYFEIVLPENLGEYVFGNIEIFTYQSNTERMEKITIPFTIMDNVLDSNAEKIDYIKGEALITGVRQYGNDRFLITTPHNNVYYKFNTTQFY